MRNNTMIRHWSIVATATALVLGVSGLALAQRRTPMSKTNAELPDHAWFALADAEHCRLLCCRLTEQGTQHVDEYDALENTCPEREPMRPQTGDGMTHDVEEKERRFAGQIVGCRRTPKGA
jgi:hypothetical protein